ncbi:hypothetical protein HOH87_05605 [bacterium]|mgnify:CR=1 FL=1|jgi:Spy/CpxP family protein refolding chaperone|nr:hypothetical protein [bacterium]
MSLFKNKENRLSLAVFAVVLLVVGYGLGKACDLGKCSSSRGNGYSKSCPIKSGSNCHSKYQEKKVKRLTKKLNLTPEQQVQVTTILEKHTPAYKQAKSDFHDEIMVIKSLKKSDIRAILTPEQQAKFDTMKKKCKSCTIEKKCDSCSIDKNADKKCSSCTIEKKCAKCSIKK